MTIEELSKDTALQAELAQEIEAKIKDGTDPSEAKVQALKARGIEFDEDALKAEAVGRMKLSDEAMETVAGGLDTKELCFATDFVCITVSACLTVMLHGSVTHVDDGCWSDYQCVTIYHHGM